MVFLLTTLAPDPPPLLTNVNNKMFFFIEGFPYLYCATSKDMVDIAIAFPTPQMNLPMISSEMWGDTAIESQPSTITRQDICIILLGPNITAM